jgi:hypothetical protein
MSKKRKAQAEREQQLMDAVAAKTIFAAVKALRAAVAEAEEESHLIVQVESLEDFAKSVLNYASYEPDGYITVARHYYAWDDE